MGVERRWILSVTYSTGLWGGLRSSGLNDVRVNSTCSCKHVSLHLRWQNLNEPQEYPYEHG